MFFNIVPVKDYFVFSKDFLDFFGGLGGLARACLSWCCFLTLIISGWLAYVRTGGTLAAVMLGLVLYPIRTPDITSPRLAAATDSKGRVGVAVELLEKQAAERRVQNLAASCASLSLRYVHIEMSEIAASTRN
jgi:hypothetical protein